jgi:hypothetical protein
VAGATQVEGGEQTAKAATNYYDSWAIFCHRQLPSIHEFANVSRQTVLWHGIKSQTRANWTLR